MCREGGIERVQRVHTDTSLQKRDDEDNIFNRKMEVCPSASSPLKNLLFFFFLQIKKWIRVGGEHTDNGSATKK